MPDPLPLPQAGPVPVVVVATWLVPMEPSAEGGPSVLVWKVRTGVAEGLVCATDGNQDCRHVRLAKAKGLL